MAITVNIYYKGKDDNAKKFAEEMIASGTVDLIRKEKGNLKYEYFVPFDDKNTVLLIDSWESQEAIDLHHHSPMMKTILELREKYNLTMKVERFISDKDGIPESDKKFIKNAANVSICGSDCSKCYCFESKMCNGCNEHKGVVFHCNGKECAIYNCCVTKNGFKNCSECREVPCEIWKKTRDPKFSDEEFAKNIEERIEKLKSL